MKKTVALFEQQGVLGRRFCEYINRREELPVKVLLFTESSRLLAYCGQRTVDLLVCDEEERELVCGAEVKSHLYLTRSRLEGQEDGEKTVYKYRPADQLLQSVLEELAGGKEEQKSLSKSKTAVYGVFSGDCSVNASLFSLLLGQAVSARRSALCLTLEALPGLENIVLTGVRSSLSDALYYYRQGELLQRLPSLSGTWHQLNVLGSVSCPEDLGSLEEETFSGMLEEIAESGLYDCLIINCGTSLSMGMEVFPYCRKLFLPEGEDALSVLRQEYLKEWLEHFAPAEGIDTVFFAFSPAKMDAAPALWLESELWGTSGNMVTALAAGQGMDV